MGLGISSICRYLGKRTQVKIDKLFDRALESKSFQKWVECASDPKYHEWQRINDPFSGNILDKYM